MEQQVKPDGREVEGQRCAECGGESSVYCSVLPKRHRKCLSCGATWATLEVRSALIDGYVGGVRVLYDCVRTAILATEEAAEAASALGELVELGGLLPPESEETGDGDE